MTYKDFSILIPCSRDPIPTILSLLYACPLEQPLPIAVGLTNSLVMVPTWLLRYANDIFQTKINIFYVDDSEGIFGIRRNALNSLPDIVKTVLFVDDDIIVPPGAIEALLSIWKPLISKSPNLTAALQGSRVEIGGRGWSDNDITPMKNRSLTAPIESGQECMQIPYADTCFALINKELYLSIFADKRFKSIAKKGIAGEDVLAGRILTERGYCCYGTALARVAHISGPNNGYWSNFTASDALIEHLMQKTI